MNIVQLILFQISVDITLELDTFLRPFRVAGVPCLFLLLWSCLQLKNCHLSTPLFPNSMTGYIILMVDMFYLSRIRKQNNKIIIIIIILVVMRYGQGIHFKENENYMSHMYVVQRIISSLSWILLLILCWHYDSIV